MHSWTVSWLRVFRWVIDTLMMCQDSCFCGGAAGLEPNSTLHYTNKLYKLLDNLYIGVKLPVDKQCNKSMGGLPPADKS